MFVENFDEMYTKMSEVRDRYSRSIMNDCDDKPFDDMFMIEFRMEAVALIQNSIDRLRELGVPDYAMSFTVAELAVLSRMPDFDIKIRWVTTDGKTFIT